MRLWSIHPKYLDTRGLVALWRETLLAKQVLEGKTKGYKHHPQLKRFTASKNPLQAINQYLETIYNQAQKRGYNFNKSKFTAGIKNNRIKVSTGQLNYEAKHLLKKLKTRDAQKFSEPKKVKSFIPNPFFIPVHGNVEDWEIV